MGLVPHILLHEWCEEIGAAQRRGWERTGTHLETVHTIEVANDASESMEKVRDRDQLDRQETSKFIVGNPKDSNDSHVRRIREAKEMDKQGSTVKFKARAYKCCGSMS